MAGHYVIGLLRLLPYLPPLVGQQRDRLTSGVPSHECIYCQPLFSDYFEDNSPFFKSFKLGDCYTYILP